jgi:hypothetical protein
MTIARFDFNFALYEKGGDDSLDIEYYGFFKTKEAVESYIGKTVNLDPPAGPSDGTESQPDSSDSETDKDTNVPTTSLSTDSNTSDTTVGGDITTIGGDVTTGADAPSDLSVIGIEGILLIVAGVLVVVAVVVYFVIYKKKK